MIPRSAKIFTFGAFRLDPNENLLEKAGKPIPLKPKAFAALVQLVENHGSLVEKSDLLDRVWNGAFVEEASVSKCIWEIRSALQDDSREGRYIQTVPKHGYRFVGDVETIESNNGLGSKTAENADAGSNGSQVQAPKTDVGELESTQDGSVTADPADLQVTARAQSRRKNLTAYFAVGLTAILVIGLFVYKKYAIPVAGQAENIATLAILPLRPVIAEERDQALELAIADSLITAVSESKALNVKRLFAVRKFTDPNSDPLAAGRELEVSYILSSTYQIFDGRIRVTSQLINVETGNAEQTFRSETRAGNIFMVQDAISKEISGSLFASFGTTANRTPLPKHETRNEKAYTLYNEALFLLDKYDQNDTVKAVGLLDQAVRMDPDYAAAWAAKAQAYCQFAHQGGGVPTEIFPKAAPNLDKALAIEEDNVVALTIRGMINRDYNWDLPAAYRDLDRAIALDPNATLPHRLLAGAFYQEGRFSEALIEGRKAVDLNPTGRWDKWFLASYEAAVGDTDGAIATLKHLIDIEPDFQPAYYSLWETLYLAGKNDEAFDYFVRGKKKSLRRSKGDRAIPRYL